MTGLQDGNNKELIAAAALLAGGGALVLLLRRRRQRAHHEAEPTSPTIVPAFHKLLAQRAATTRIARPSVEGERVPTPLVVQVVLTGGPVGGKSSLAARLSKRLGALGWRVVIAPSVVTLMLNSNCVLPPPNDSRAQVQFEGAVLEMQHALEGAFKRAAGVTGDKCVVIYDRGVLDVGVFLPREQWPALVNEFPTVRRPPDWYHCIVHLVTAADGAADAFAKEMLERGKKGTCASLPPLPANASRASDEAVKHLSTAREHALRIDRNVHDVQSGHPHYVRVDNDGGFEAKLSRAVEAVVERVQAVEDELTFDELRGRDP